LLAFLRKHQIPTPETLVDGRFSILIVEDDEAILDVLKTFFQRQGSFEISCASDAISALIEVGRTKPDLLILDIMIPGVDGIEVCRRIKGDSAKKTVIIAISGQASAEKRILEAGADVFMAKPLDLDKLHDEAKSLLRIL
jgi:two-component system response regulator MprA